MPSHLTAFNLPWFMDLTFQVPMQLCSLQHQTLLSPPDTSTTGCCFHFGSASSFLLELYLCSSPAAYWAPTDLGVHLSVSCLFTFSYCSWGSQGKNDEVVCHSLLQWPTFCQNSPPWPICLGWPYRAWLTVSELDKTVIHVISLVSFLWLWFLFCLSSDGWALEACRNFLMGRTGCGENWVLLWWAKPCSVNL